MNFDFQVISKTHYSLAFSIQQSCHLNPWSESVFLDSLTSPYFAFQLVVDDLTLGYYVGLNVAGEATLMDIGVHKERRGEGLGAHLLSHFIQQCKLLHCEEAWLEVRESNQVAAKLYAKNGFDIVDVRKDYYPTESGRENGLIMKMTFAS